MADVGRFGAASVANDPLGKQRGDLATPLDRRQVAMGRNSRRHESASISAGSKIGKHMWVHP